MLCSLGNLVSAAEPQDSQLFVNSINDYKKGDYPAVVDKLNQVLTKYPQTPLRDMSLYWLGRAYFKVGNQQEAARYLSQFKKEYPDNPLIFNIEEGLTDLIARYERGEKLLTAGAPGKPSISVEELDRLAKEKAAEEAAAAEKVAAEKLAAAKAAADKAAKEKIEAEREAAERLAAAKAAEDRLKAENAEIARLAEKSATEQLAAVKAALAKAEAERQAAEANRIAVEKSAEARISAALAAADKAEAERRLAEKSAKEYQDAAAMALKVAESAKKAAQEYQEAATKALKAAEDAKKQGSVKPAVTVVPAVVPVPAGTAAIEAKLAAERAAREKAEAALKAEREARQKAEQERLAGERKTKEQLEEALKSERAARLKAEEERTVAERLALQKAEEALKKERAARLKAEEEKAVAERIAAEKAIRSAKPVLAPSATVSAPTVKGVSLPKPDSSEPQAPAQSAESVTNSKQSNVIFTENTTSTKANPAPAVKKEIEFSDLPPAKQSELEFLCFQAKAKGRFQFNECIKAHLSPQE